MCGSFRSLVSFCRDMAREVELKRIELKVTANCCDGCKRKVKKALRNVEGVLRTEIDPSQPKLTVIGTVDPRILIKKLTRVGKHAEMLSMKEILNAGTECEQPKHPVSCDTKPIKSTEETSNPVDEGNKKGSKKEQNDTNIDSKVVTDTYKEVINNEEPPPPPQTHHQVSFNVYPSMVHETGNNQHCYKVVEPPCAVPMPCSAMPSYSYPAPMPAMSYGRPDYYYYQYEQPAFQAPVMQAGDYFSDDNTIGCHIM